MDDNSIATQRDDVRDYYGRVLEDKNDLKTSACCPVEAMPVWARPLVGNIETEILDRFYGCGSPLPLAAEGRTVLDLGCGTGRDCYILSQMVGPQGRVIGIDMTEGQLDVARRHLDTQMRRFGYSAPNVDFHHSFIEDLGTAGIADNSVDVVVSNCVINLSPDKERVFSEIFRVLKPGGELVFSDVFAGRRVPEDIRTDKVLVGECLGGAMYIEDFRRMLRRLGCFDYRVVSRAPISLDDPDVQRRAGMIDFHSVTVRTFKIDFEDICENYGHVARYRGTIAAAPHGFDLDDHHHFATGLPVPVCGNTARMLSETRLGDHFEVQGDFSTHYGPFDCGPLGAPTGTGGPAEGACC
ncbi:MAG: methyltransferase domain-containing protein [Rhodospirillales bacterium]|nr:methyltransferase domain-containing protein [Rhodospirillales bacterium]